MNAYAAMKQYQTVNVNAQVSEADPHRLIQMLMEGALQRIAQARGALQHGNVALKGEQIGKATANVDQGGELAANLDRLYAFMQQRLSEANLKNDAAMLDEVSELLREIKAGWDGIRQA